MVVKMKMSLTLLFGLFLNNMMIPQNHHLLSKQYFYSIDSDAEYKYHFYGMMDSVEAFNKNPLPFTTNIFQNMISIYQGNLSKSNCQFTPSCSRYSYLAYDKYGFFNGTVLTLKRLWQCNSEADKYYRHLGIYLYDPPYEPSSIKTEFISYKKNDADFIPWLIKNKEYDAAYSELIKKEFYKAEYENRMLLSKISFLKADYKKAINWLSEENSKEATFLKARCYYLMDNFKFSRRTLKPILLNDSSFDSSLAGLWLHSLIESPDKDDLGTLAEIFTRMSNIENNSVLRSDIEDIASDHPSGLASLLYSIPIPGSGQIINGQIEDGIFALIFTSVLGYITFQNIKSEDYLDAAFWGLGFTLTYSANLIAAYNAPARKYRVNLNLIHVELNKLFDPFSEIYFSK